MIWMLFLLKTTYLLCYNCFIEFKVSIYYYGIYLINYQGETSNLSEE